MEEKMKYNQSDFARNKKSENIVYKFIDGVIKEISLEEFLKDDPECTLERFEEIKAVSDGNYHESDLSDTKHRRHNLSLDSFDYEPNRTIITLEDQHILNEAKINAVRAANELFEDKKLTDKQKNRFAMHYILGISMRTIAKKEGINVSSVSRSLELARKKLVNIFEKF